MIVALAMMLTFTHPQMQAHVLRSGNWRISVNRDVFSGWSSCRLEGRGPAHGARYIKGAMIFQFPHRWNTMEALYRVDNGPAKRWQDAYPLLAEHHIDVSGDSLANPTSGEVILPLEYVHGSNIVAIRARRTGRPHSFYLSGLDVALASARAAGCMSDTMFVR